MLPDYECTRGASDCQGKKRKVGSCPLCRYLPFRGSHLRLSILPLWPLPVASRLDQNVSRNTQLVVEVPDHFEREGALLLKNFVDPCALPDYADQGASVLALLLEAELDGLDGVRQVDGVVFPLVSFDQGSQDVEFIEFGRAILEV